MAYVLGGGNNEADGFTTAIANFALRAMHESTGLVDYTTVVAPNQGNQYLVPQFAPITYQDYNPNTGAANAGFGNAPAAYEQNPALGQGSITATPAVAATAFDIFYAWTTSFELAATLGAELGESYGEKVDIRVCQAFTSFKATPSNTNYSPTPADGFARPTQLGAMELIEAGGNTAPGTAGFTSNTVLDLVRNVKQNYKVARLPGAPIIVLDSNGLIDAATANAAGGSGSTMTRLLAELTGGAVNQPGGYGGTSLSALGNELLATGRLDNVYGCKVAFTTFLPSTTRTVAGAANSNVIVGAYFHESALITVLKEGLQIKMGEKPGGLQMWLTGVAYMGSGVADPRRGGAINILQN
jgi:hypothetical protein